MEPTPGRARGAAGMERTAHLTRNCSFHTWPLLWHTSRRRRQVLDTRPMSSAVREPLQRMYSSTSPGSCTRQLGPAASAAASSASAGTTSIALSPATAAILSAYLRGRSAGARAGAKGRARNSVTPTRGVAPWCPAHTRSTGALGRKDQGCGDASPGSEYPNSISIKKKLGWVLVSAAHLRKRDRYRED